MTEIEELKAELAKFKSKAMMRANNIEHLEAEILNLKGTINDEFQSGYNMGWDDRGGGGD